MATASMTQDPSTLSVPSRRRLGQPIPQEGENGLFSQSWFPICLSSEVQSGQILGSDFLDGRVVVFRGESGRAQVLSAYCPHVGSDLAVGDVQGDTIRCAFHHWQYDQSGCVSEQVSAINRHQVRVYSSFPPLNGTDSSGPLTAKRRHSICLIFHIPMTS